MTSLQARSARLLRRFTARGSWRMSTAALAQPRSFRRAGFVRRVLGMPRPAGRPVRSRRALEVEGGIVVAFLNLDRSPIGTLVEAKLRSKKIVNWWRRGATSKLLDDLELSTAIDIPPAANDVSPAKLPDALILCRTRLQDKDRICEIVVCEPGLGLRLGTVRLTLTKEVRRGCRKVGGWNRQSTRKTRRRNERVMGRSAATEQGPGLQIRFAPHPARKYRRRRAAPPQRGAARGIGIRPRCCPGPETCRHQ